MIFQEPSDLFESCYGNLVFRFVRYPVHNPNMSKQEVDQKALDMIKLVGIPAPEEIFVIST